MPLDRPFRQTTQTLAPASHQLVRGYDIYPAYPIESGQIHLGMNTLAAQIAGAKRVVIDGYGGVLWNHFVEELQAALEKIGVSADCLCVDKALRTESEIQALIQPFLGGDDPLFGTRFMGSITEFFDPVRLSKIQPESSTTLNIVYGCGAALVNWQDARLIYVDIPKNEIQFRSRAGSVTNFGAKSAYDPKRMYKQFYFVDWPVLNRHKQALLPHIDLIVDAQRPDEITWMTGEALREGLDAQSKTVFRVRPWFEPGPWGGQWLKNHLPELAPDAPNLAWSFELIAPENGLMFSSDGRLLEVSFDFLMYQAHEAVLGDCAERFGYDFPIRFDYLDTINGGNLSLQCHPEPGYIQEKFGESFTQDETYYILDCTEDADVYLGFQPGIDPAAFRQELERSHAEGREVAVEQYVQKLPAHRHDLFLIPSGTVHCSGAGNLVLEISATPYIFTFKMYDWLRLDLNGQPRTLNIDRAFANLNFGRRGEIIPREFVSHPKLLETGSDWKLFHLPTHPDHFYDVQRLEFESEVSIDAEKKCHVLAVVEGEGVVFETSTGYRTEFAYAETFVVPAATDEYRLVAMGATPVKVIKAFVR